MNVSEHIDWIAFTVKESQMIPILDELDLKILPEPATPRHGYKTAYNLSPGGLLMAGSKNSRLGAHFILSGSALTALRSRDEKSDYKVVSLAYRAAKNITRIDIAIDMIDAELTPHDIAHMWLQGECKTRLQADKAIGSVSQIETFTLGTRRRRQVRVYDKALELKLENFEKKWTRVELETRRGAENISKLIAESAESSLRSIVRRYIDFPDSQQWRDAFAAPAAAVPHIEKDEPDTEAWLLKTVPAPLAKVLRERFKDGGIESVERFIKTLMDKTREKMIE